MSKILRNFIHMSLLLCLVCFCSNATDQADTNAKKKKSLFDEKQINQIHMKHIHNSYLKEKQVSLYDQAKNYMIRSFELDLHVHRTIAYNIAPCGNWFVYHSIPVETNYEFLSQALDDIKEFHDDDPDHEVITIWLEIKDCLSCYENGHTPHDLDELIKDTFTEGSIYMPKNMLARGEGETTTLRETVQIYGWPTLSELRGKFIFIIFGNRDPYINYYENDTAAIFLQDQGDLGDKSNAIFINVGENYTIAEFYAGLVNRITLVYTPADVADAISKRTQYIGTDDVNLIFVPIYPVKLFNTPCEMGIGVTCCE